jgi:hypothetical protein
VSFGSLNFSNHQGLALRPFKVQFFAVRITGRIISVKLLQLRLYCKQTTRQSYAQWIKWSQNMISMHTYCIQWFCKVSIFSHKVTSNCAITLEYKRYIVFHKWPTRVYFAHNTTRVRRIHTSKISHVSDLVEQVIRGALLYPVSSSISVVCRSESAVSGRRSQLWPHR